MDGGRADAETAAGDPGRIAARFREEARMKTGRSDQLEHFVRAVHALTAEPSRANVDRYLSASLQLDRSQPSRGRRRPAVRTQGREAA
jgi:hypothetical protein